MRILIEPYNVYSKSYRALRDQLRAMGHHCRTVTPFTTRSPFRRDVHAYVQWGHSPPCPEFIVSRDLTTDLKRFNCDRAKVAAALNKLETYRILQDLCPLFTTCYDEARQWITEGHRVVGRAKLTASGGAGITVYSADNLIPEDHKDKVWTKYIKKKAEYRVHVFNGRVIHVQQKKKRREAEAINTEVRNLEGGWVYCTDGVVAPVCVTDVGVRAVSLLGLDFGAVDVIYNQKQDKPYVLEVNTAPGLEGQTVVKYAEAIVNE